MVAEFGRILKLGGHAYFTLGSKRDSRFGVGAQIGHETFTPQTGDEQGVPHSYFDEAGVRNLLRRFALIELAEHSVDDIAGRWAHASAPLRGAVHWFVIIRKSS